MAADIGDPSMRHQGRDRHRLEYPAGGTAEDELAQAGMAVTAHDDQVGRGIGGIEGISIEPNPYTLSMQVRGEGVTRLLIQLADDGNNGVSGDFDLAGIGVSLSKMGQADKTDSSIRKADGDWLQLTRTTTLVLGKARVTFRLADKAGNVLFTPNGESIFLRAVQLERGQSASAYSGQRRSDARAADRVPGAPN